jgi:hypothetical protein
MERPPAAFPCAAIFFSTRGTVSHTLIVLYVGPWRLNDRNVGTERCAPTSSGACTVT